MQAIQVNSQPAPVPVKAVGVDVGYGFVKAISAAARVSFPAVVAPCVEDPLSGMFRDGTGHKVKVRKTGGEAEEKLVGEAALRSMAATATLSREKPAALHDLLLLAAAYLAGAGDKGPFPKQVDLAVGLPLAYFRAQKEALKKRLEGLAAWVSVDGGEERYISFDQVMVFPQGAGAVLAGDVILSGRGYLGVVDVGTYTTDYLLFEDRGDGVPRPLPEACGSLEVGVHLLHRSLAAEFQRRADAPLAPAMYQEVVEGAMAGRPVHYGGRDICLEEAFMKARKDVGQAIVQGVLAAWGGRAGFVALTLLAGGGAGLFKDELVRDLPGAGIYGDPFFANAMGYFKMVCNKA
ncbi:ParM/StbA family protein [Moorella sulfitireducens (nom. illeg.)]|uniref:ParM/StbA family protein n=1 Tax=Neomoorella sulfitireducens TaxID=2972948 RepID=UPI0021ABEE80|nr:ParM/StbA family protein [Moorella sulfitireducens]